MVGLNVINARDFTDLHPHALTLNTRIVIEEIIWSIIMANSPAAKP